MHISLLQTRKATIAAILFASAWIALLTGLYASADNSAVKTTQQVYKNIQVLKDVPADQLIPAMQFITMSLGVECDFCHVSGAFEKDDKKPKQTARKMMLMMFAINHDNFGGKRKVTCYSCHRGNHKPLDTAVIADGQSDVSEPASRPLTTAVTLPPVEKILAAYTQAVGGEKAIQQIKTRISEGKATISGRDFPIEVSYETPDKICTVIRLPNGDDVSTVDGKAGWISFPGHPVREMEQYEVDGALLEGDLHLPIDLLQTSGELLTAGQEKINSQEAYVVSRSVRGVNLQLYFDEQSGFLVRLLRYVESPLGRIPIQVDYGDYRQNGAVKIPFRWVVARPGSSFSVQLERVRDNMPIKPERFSKPAAPNSEQQ